MPPEGGVVEQLPERDCTGGIADGAGGSDRSAGWDAGGRAVAPGGVGDVAVAGAVPPSPAATSWARSASVSGRDAEQPRTTSVPSGRAFAKNRCAAPVSRNGVPQSGSVWT